MNNKMIQVGDKVKELWTDHVWTVHAVSEAGPITLVRKVGFFRKKEIFCQVVSEDHLILIKKGKK